jgi:hypothetical protein
VFLRALVVPMPVLNWKNVLLLTGQGSHLH